MTDRLKIELSKIKINEVIEEIDRELEMRKKIYEKQIKYQKITRKVANERYLRLRKAKALIEEIRENDKQKGYS